MLIQTYLRVALAAATLCLPCTAQSGDAPESKAVVETSSTYSPTQQFDEKRDVAADVQAAISEARRTHKRIILYVGGDWCMYCGQMHELFRKNSDLVQLRDSAFITVPVAYGYGKKDQDQVLAPYTKVLGIPHFFVLDSDGTLLHSQHVVELRENGDYDATKMRDFLNRWSGGEKKASK
jgi:thiol:disulfide interchange protein